MNHLVVGGSLVARSPIRVDGNLVLEPGGILTHPPRLFGGLVVQFAGRLEVQAGGSIDLDGRGLLGGYTAATQRSGETFDDSGRIVSGSTGLGTAGAGGSYGGRGGDSSTGGRAGSSYGSNTDPRWLAAGGGSGGAGGGSGGGRATIRAGACTVNGVIQANGAAGAPERRGWAPGNEGGVINSAVCRSSPCGLRSGLPPPCSGHRKIDSEGMISVVVVNWNSGPILEHCIRSLRTHAASCEIVLVDNASDDGSLEFLSHREHTLRLHRNDQNLGFAAASNIGWRLGQGDPVLFLNPDAQCTEGAVRRLEEPLLDDEGVMGLSGDC